MLRQHASLSLPSPFITTALPLPHPQTISHNNSQQQQSKINTPLVERWRRKWHELPGRVIARTSLTISLAICCPPSSSDLVSYYYVYKYIYILLFGLLIVSADQMVVVDGGGEHAHDHDHEKTTVLKKVKDKAKKIKHNLTSNMHHGGHDDDQYRVHASPVDEDHIEEYDKEEVIVTQPQLFHEVPGIYKFVNVACFSSYI